MIPRLLVLTPNDGRPLTKLLEWLDIIAKAGVSGLILREAKRDPGSNQRALERALELFDFVSLHHRSRLPAGNKLRPQAFHLPRDQTQPPHGQFGHSCHHQNELETSLSRGAAYALLSPVYRPTSKPNDSRTPMGVQRFIELANNKPVFALGGVNAARYRDLRSAGAFGAAVLGDFAAIQTVAEARVKLAGYDSSFVNGNRSAS